MTVKAKTVIEGGEEMGVGATETGCPGHYLDNIPKHTSPVIFSTLEL